MNEEKKYFLQKELIPLLQKINPSTMPAWGKMNLHQMIEHYTGAVKIATGTLILPGTKEPQENEKMKAFLMSEKPFSKNTNNPLLSEDPYPYRNHTIQAAIGELQAALLDFFATYEADPQKKVLNPFFGYLNYTEQVQLLYKHAIHHLDQFGVEPQEKA